MRKFTIHLNLGETASCSTKKWPVEGGGEVVKEEAVDNKIQQKIHNLCEDDADEFIRWNKQLDTVIKDKPYDTAKSKFVIVAAILYGYLSDTWVEYGSAVTKELHNKNRTNESGTKGEVKEKKGIMNQSFSVYLTRLKKMLFDKFSARKQKAYMRNRFTKPSDLRVKRMVSQPLVLDLYLDRFPEP